MSEDFDCGISRRLFSNFDRDNILRTPPDDKTLFIS